jgi:hypothetical protein
MRIALLMVFISALYITCFDLQPYLQPSRRICDNSRFIGLASRALLQQQLPCIPLDVKLLHFNQGFPCVIDPYNASICDQNVDLSDGLYLCHDVYPPCNATRSRPTEKLTRLTNESNAIANFAMGLMYKRSRRCSCPRSTNDTNRREDIRNARRMVHVVNNTKTIRSEENRVTCDEMLLIVIRRCSINENVTNEDTHLSRY